MAGERRRAREQRQKKNRRQNILIGAAVLLVVAIVAVIAVVVNSGNKQESIVNAVPADVDALFISEANAGTWEYMEALADTEPLQDIVAADYVGVAWTGGKSYFYAAGPERKMNKELEERGLDVPHRDGIYVLKGGDEALAKTEPGTFGDSENRRSFAYLTNKHTESDYFKDGSGAGLPENKWTWSGMFEETRWLGEIEGISPKVINVDKVYNWAMFEEKPAWTRNFLVEDKGTVSISLEREQIEEVTGQDFDTRVRTFDMYLHEDGTAEVSLGRN